jgi:hypothetical protein
MPTIDSISPAFGYTGGGDAVTISGSGFVDGLTVTIGGGDASEIVVSGDGLSITCLTPAGTTGPVDVVVTNPDASSATLLGGFFYGVAISSLSPAFGFTGGGDTITITGQGFIASGIAVTFGGNSATITSVSSDGTSITCFSPASMAGAGFVDVVVTNSNSDSATLSNGFFYGVNVASVSPTFGPIGVATPVTISGNGFISSGITVAIGGTPPTSISVRGSFRTGVGR